MVSHHGPPGARHERWAARALAAGLEQDRGRAREPAVDRQPGLARDLARVATRRQDPGVRPRRRSGPAVPRRGRGGAARVEAPSRIARHVAALAGRARGGLAAVGVRVSERDVAVRAAHDRRELRTRRREGFRVPERRRRRREGRRRRTIIRIIFTASSQTRRGRAGSVRPLRPAHPPHRPVQRRRERRRRHERLRHLPHRVHPRRRRTERRLSARRLERPRDPPRLRVPRPLPRARGVHRERRIGRRGRVRLRAVTRDALQGDVHRGVARQSSHRARGGD